MVQGTMEVDRDNGNDSDGTIDVQEEIMGFTKGLHDMGTEMACCICKSLFSNPYSLPCHHSLCRKCIDDLVSSMAPSKPVCPLCKAEFTKRSIYPNEILTALVDIYRRLHPPVKEESGLLTQACDVSQIFRELGGQVVESPGKLETARSEKVKQLKQMFDHDSDDESDPEANTLQVNSMDDDDTNLEVENTPLRTPASLRTAALVTGNHADDTPATLILSTSTKNDSTVETPFTCPRRVSRRASSTSILPDSVNIGGKKSRCTESTSIHPCNLFKANEFEQSPNKYADKDGDKTTESHTECSEPKTRESSLSLLASTRAEHAKVAKLATDGLAKNTMSHTPLKVGDIMRRAPSPGSTPAERNTETTSEAEICMTKLPPIAEMATSETHTGKCAISSSPTSKNTLVEANEIVPEAVSTSSSSKQGNVGDAIAVTNKTTPLGTTNLEHTGIVPVEDSYVSSSEHITTKGGKLSIAVTEKAPEDPVTKTKVITSLTTENRTTEGSTEERATEIPASRHQTTGGSALTKEIAKLATENLITVESTVVNTSSKKMNQVESAVKVSASSAQPDSSLSTPDIHGEKASGIPIEETQTTEDESTGTRTASESREEKAVNVDPVIKDTKAKSRHEGELQTINQAVGNGDTYEGPERVAPFFVVGNTVTVSRRMYPGSNKPGGAAKITKVNDDDTYDVRYIVARNTEKRVPGKEITAGININSSSFFGNGLHQEEEDSPLLTSHGRPERQNTTRLLFDPSLYHHSMDPFSQTTAKKKREGEVKVLNKKRHKSLPGNFSTSTDTRETPPEAKSPKKRKSLSSFHDSDMTNSNSGALVRSGSRNSKRKKRICPVASGFSTGPPPVILLTGSLGKSSSKDRAIDQILAMSGKYMPELDDTVTHVVVQHDRKIKGRLVARNRTYKYICAIAKGLWVLDVKWIRDSAHAGRWLDEAKYEIDGDLITKDFNTGGPKRSRERLVNQDVPLLRNFVIYICGSFPQTNLQKANYRLIIEMCGGMALTSSNADCMKKLESTKEKAYILCQNIEYATLDKNYSKIQQLVEQGGAHFVNGQWLINSVSTYTLQKENKYYPS